MLVQEENELWNIIPEENDDTTDIQGNLSEVAADISRSYSFCCM